MRWTRTGPPIIKTEACSKETTSNGKLHSREADTIRIWYKGEEMLRLKPNQSSSIHAVIGVWHRGAKTFYVRRSAKMKNYPLVWSLFSMQFKPEALPDPFDLDAVRVLMHQMALERLGGAVVGLERYLS